MLSCQNFKQWLFDQGAAADENIFQLAMDHLEDCQTCNRLYQSDMALDETLRKAMRAIDPPQGLIIRARQKIESESRPNLVGWISAFWKPATAALSLASLVLIILVHPFSGQLKSLDEVAAHSIANHLNTSMKIDVVAGEVSEMAQWFAHGVEHEVRLPDLDRLGLTLLGGRKCALGKVTAALLFCDSKGKNASLFVIRQNDVRLSFKKVRKYTVESGDHQVTVWKELGLVYALVI